MKNNLQVVFLAVTVLILSSLACSVLNSNVLLEDNFNSEDWGTGTDADSSVEYSNNALKFFVNKDSFFVWSTPNSDDYENVHIEVTAKNDSTDSIGSFGIICNLNSVTDTSYYFAVAGDGEYAIGRYTLVDDVLLTNDGQWGNSDVITSGTASYRIGADCGNGTLALYVDGQLVDSVNDDYYTTGNVGLFAWSGKEPDGTDVTFDDFVVTKLNK